MMRMVRMAYREREREIEAMLGQPNILGIRMNWAIIENIAHPSK